MRCCAGLVWAVGFLALATPARSGELSLTPGRWTRLAAPPADPTGREMSPGMMGAWAWVPEMKAFLLYGGRSPAFSNGMWSFDPAGKKWKLLTLCDRLIRDPETKAVSARRPGEIPWSTGRPAPGSDFGAVYDPGFKCLWMAGGWRYSGVGDWGKARFGTWRFDGRTGKFTPGPTGGPGGLLKLVYDSRNRLVVTNPHYDRRGKTTVTWVLSPAAGKWEGRTSKAGPRWSGHPAMAFDSKAGRVVYFDEWGQTWTYDAAKSAWKDAKPAKGPPRRRHAACWYDPEAGRTFLHGGISQDYPPGKYVPGRSCYVSFYTNEWGLQYSDLWSYDAARNEWRQEKAAGAPARGKKPIFRDLCSYVPELKAAVMYEPTVGVWAYRHGK